MQISTPFIPKFPVPYAVVLLVGLSLCYSTTTEAQRLDMKVLGNRRRIEIPFDLENDFIVIPVLVNSVFPLRFIIDTGAENTVLLEKEVTDILNVSYRRSFEIRGADVETILTAHLATGVDLRLADRLLARNRSVLVLEENYINFERITGTHIHGILGGDFLMRFVVQFDFKRQLMILHEPAKYKHSRSFVEVPSNFVRNRPYLNMEVGVLRDSTTERKLLLDTGAGLSLLMHTFNDTLSADLPAQTVPAYIANGLGGTLSGTVGRSRLVKIADRELENVVTYFQEVDTSAADFLNSREGIIGNRILKRFNVVIDYVKRKVYFKAEPGIWRRKFRYDRSGLSIIAGGTNLRQYFVSSVVPDSPAGRAGLQVGDRIRAINGVSVSLLNLETIIRKLERRQGKRVRLRYYRNGRLTDVTFKLEDLI